MAHFRDILPFSTWPRYLLWHYTQRKAFGCRLLEGPEISIRPEPTHDYQTAYEIFFDGIYGMYRFTLGCLEIDRPGVPS